MTTTRYDRRAVIAALNSTQSEYAQVVGLVTSDTPAPYREVPRLWCERVVADCLSGKIPPFDAFPELALTAASPGNDRRWTPYNYLLAKLEDLPVLFVSDDDAQQVGALQLISDEKVAFLAANKAVQGRFWVWIDGRPHLEIGMEMADRANASHITALFGTVEGAPAAIVVWQTTPSVIRTASGERLQEMLQNSIFVSGARARWEGLRPRIDPDEIRSAWFEADHAGTHPDAMGSKIVDLLETSYGAGLPSRRTLVELTDLSNSDLATMEAASGAGSGIAEDVASGGRLEQLYDALSPDERVLFDAMKRELGVAPTALAQMNGWAIADVKATLKRIQRKASKTAKGP